MPSMQDAPEIWKDISGFEGFYQISDLGRVKSLARTISIYNPANGFTVLRDISEKIRKPSKSNYLNVNLTRNGKSFVREIHRLVLEVFVGPCPKGMEACHFDGNKWNNKLNNLRWDTRKNNHKDNIRNGTRMYGKKNPSYGKRNTNSAKLTEGQVRTIRVLRSQGRMLKDLSRIFGVSEATISNIDHNKHWQHVRSTVCQV